MKTENKRGIFGILFWILFSIYVAAKSYRFGLGNWHKPGPGYFPFGAALLIGMVSAGLLLRILLRSPAEEISNRVSIFQTSSTVLSVVAMTAYILFLKTIGFVLCNFLFAVFFLHVVMRTRWGTTLIVAVCASLGFHVFFNILLDAQLPGGLLSF
jgi:hypothetical protein